MFEIIGYWFAVSFSTVVMLYTPVFFGSYLVACLIKASIPDKEDGKAFYNTIADWQNKYSGAKLINDVDTGKEVIIVISVVLMYMVSGFLSGAALISLLFEDVAISDIIKTISEFSLGATLFFAVVFKVILAGFAVNRVIHYGYKGVVITRLMKKHIADKNIHR